MKLGYYGAVLTPVLLLQSAPIWAADPVPFPPPAPIEAPAKAANTGNTLAVPVPPALKTYGPAPKAAAPAPPPKDGKARKEARRKREADSTNCLSKSVSIVGRPIIPLFSQGEKSTTDVRVIPSIGLSSCDAMLALAPDDDDAWDRRAQLLQGRATHLIALGAHDAALESLDEADAIGATRNDSLFNGGLGIGNSMLRAFALGEQGKKEAALAEISRARNLRPHASFIGRAFDQIENHLHYDIDAMLEKGVSRIKWQPDLMRGLLPLFIWRSNMEGAARFVDDVSTINPKPIGGWTIDGTQSAGRQLRTDIEIKLERAYIWAALGNIEKSGSIIAATQSDIAEYIGNKPVAEPGRKVSKSAMADYEARVNLGRSIEDLVERWQGAIQLRADTASMPAEALFDRAQKLGVTYLIAWLDFLRQLKFSNAEKQAQFTALIEKSDKNISDNFLKLDVHIVRDMLPEPEYLADVPRFSSAGDGILFDRENGFSQAKEKGSDISTIRFGTNSGSGPMADELALLAVAQYAKKEGKDSFILLARRLIKRTTNVSGYYTGRYSFDSGYESQMRVALLDSANLPAEWAEKRHRLIMVSQVLEEIKPRYDALEARKAASKAK
jgi:tetratricopeptide (TPR) repeat protein